MELGRRRFLLLFILVHAVIYSVTFNYKAAPVAEWLRALIFHYLT